MDSRMARRDFLKAVPVTAYALAQAAEGITLQSPPAAGMIKIEPFGIHLRRAAAGRAVSAAIPGGAGFLPGRFR